MFAALGMLPTVGILMGVTLLVVVVSAALEQRGSRVRTVTRAASSTETTTRSTTERVEEPPRVATNGSGREPRRPLAPGPAPTVPGSERTVSSERTASSEQVGRPAPEPVTTLVLSSDGADARTARIGPLGTDRQLAGVLFAAYVVAGRPESSRVTGWITAYDDPPSLPDTAAGERMRGRATRIAELLDCDDEDRNWVTLDQGTDVALAVRRRPPVDPVLVGLLHWWRLATSDVATVAASDTVALEAAIREVLPSLERNPLHRSVGSIAEIAGAAASEGVGLRLHCERSSARGPAEDETEQSRPSGRGLLTTSFAESSPVP